MEHYTVGMRAFFGLNMSGHYFGEANFAPFKLTRQGMNQF
jgi:hypothetical protein